VVPPRLQVNEMSLSEWYNKTQWDEKFVRMSKEDIRDLAVRMGYDREAVEKLIS
jgi:hypothetical protein